MSIIDNIFLLLPFFLYAETHYSFKGIYSRLKKKEPELIADAPHRVDPGQPIPIMLLIKDSHLFPVKINKIEVIIAKESDTILQKSFLISTDYIKDKYHSIIIEINPPNEITGLVKIDVKFEIATHKRAVSYAHLTLPTKRIV